MHKPLQLSKEQDRTELVSVPSMPEIIARYRAGESVQEIAKACRRDARTIYNWMLSELGDAYKDVVTECLINRVADADIALDEADDALELARAREKARFARMDLERRRPALYGPKQEVKHSGGVPTLSIVLLSAPSALPPAIDHEAIHEKRD